MWLKSKEIRNKLGLSVQALYERKKRDKIKSKVSNNIRYYWYEDENEKKRINVIYCRVSNTKQKDDLDRQESVLKQYAISNGNKIDIVYKDIASGMNEDRKDFNDLLYKVVNFEINKVFVSYKDRITRFGYKYFENIFKLFGTEIIIVNLTKEEDFQQELTQDFISIIHHFSMKLYSNRRKELKQLIELISKDDNVKISI